MKSVNIATSSGRAAYPRILGLLLMFLIPFGNHCITAQQASDLLETGQATKLTKPNQANAEFTAISYNIRWRTDKELNQISDWVMKKGATVVALQEVDRARKRTNQTNNARVIAEVLGMHYAWTAPPAVKGEK